VFRSSIAILALALALGIGYLLWPLDAARISAFLFGTVVVTAAFLFDRLKPTARGAADGVRRTVEILENIQDGFVTVDREFRIAYVNHAAEILMAKSKAELLGRSVWVVYPELLGTIVEANFRRALAEQTALHFEYCYSASNRRLDVGVYPATTGGLLVQFREITGGKHVQAASREDGERYRFQLEAANVGTWEWNFATGEDRWSGNMESIHGMPPGSFHGTIQDMMQTVHPEDRDMVSRKVRRAIDRGEQYEVEYRTIGQDGQVNWIEAKGRVLYDRYTGQPLCMIGVGTNITERKAAEMALRDSEARFRTLAKHAPVGIFQLDRSGSCVFVNEYWSARAGMTPEQSINDGWLRAVHPDDREQVLRIRSEAIRRGQPYAVNYRIQTPNGKLS
jgi:PAS domain S-box-containing protein